MFPCSAFVSVTKRWRWRPAASFLARLALFTGQKGLIDMTSDEPLFEGLGSTLIAARYHSLVVTEVPDSMKVIASTRDRGETLVMALRHRHRCQLGLQFHPESILTPLGRKLLWRFFAEAYSYGDAR